MVKLFAWESRAMEDIESRRAEELRKLQKQRLIEVVMRAVGSCMPLIAKLATFSVYVSSQTVHHAMMMLRKMTCLKLSGASHEGRNHRFVLALLHRPFSTNQLRLRTQLLEFFRP